MFTGKVEKSGVGEKERERWRDILYIFRINFTNVIRRAAKRAPYSLEKIVRDYSSDPRNMRNGCNVYSARTVNLRR